MLELHVWGPAFSLPSIDPECLAAIAYMNIILPGGYPKNSQHNNNSAHNHNTNITNDNNKKEKIWMIVPSSNPNLSPTRTLPALRDTNRNNIWIGGGFDGIVEYLGQIGRKRWDLDFELTVVPEEDEEREGEDMEGSYEYVGGRRSSKKKRIKKTIHWAESVAYKMFVRRRIGALVEWSLYGSDKNYEWVVRGALGNMVGWPECYWVPGARRDVAMHRVEEAGFKGDMVDPAYGEEIEMEIEDGGPGAFEGRLKRGPKEWVGKVLFRVKEGIEKGICPVAVRIVDNCDESGVAIEEQGQGGEEVPKAYFFRHLKHPTSLDCLIFGYLALAVYPASPPPSYSPSPAASTNGDNGEEQQKKKEKKKKQKVLPNPFLFEAIKELDDSGKGGRKLIQWIEAFRKKVFGPEPIDAEDILSGKIPSNSYLPWSKPERADLPWFTNIVFEAAKESYVVRSLSSGLWRKKEQQNDENESKEEKERKEKIEKAVRRDRWEKVACAVLGVGAFVGYLFWSGAFRFVPVIQYKEVEVEGEEEEDGREEEGEDEEEVSENEYGREEAGKEKEGDVVSVRAQGKEEESRGKAEVEIEVGI